MIGDNKRRNVNRGKSRGKLTGPRSASCNATLNTWVSLCELWVWVQVGFSMDERMARPYAFEHAATYCVYIE